MTSIGIIGYGDFGQLIATVARQFFPHIQVKVFARKQTIDNVTYFSLADVCQADILFPAVPISAFADTINDIIPLLGLATIIIDICTVKSHPAKILYDRAANSQTPKPLKSEASQTPKIQYLCTHPMFGPYSFAKKNNSLTDLRIVLADHNLDPATYTNIKNICQQLGLKIIETSADAHDQMLAKTLFLTHLVGQTLAQGGFVRTDIDTVSFGFLMDAVESVQHDTQLFHDVYRYNPYCKYVLQTFHETADRVSEQLPVISEQVAVNK